MASGKVRRFGILVAGLAVAATAVAGQRLLHNVFITNDIAFGGLSASRNSPDSVQFITCFTRSSGEGGCTLRDATGLTRACATETPAQIEVIRAIRGDSRVDIQWNAAGECTALTARNSSRYPAKQP